MKGISSSRKDTLSDGGEGSFASVGKKLRRHLACVMLSAFAVLLVHALICDNEVYGMTKKKHVVLLGASVGQAWDIEALPDRQGAAQSYRFEYVGGEYAFDKTEALKKILQWKQNKPDAIFIKECAAYFPGDLHQYQELMKGWVKECKKAGVIPIPTTVVPVVSDKNKTLKDQLKDFIKKLLGRPTTATQLAGILQYNDWVREYAVQEGLTVLDLEAPLRTSQDDRSLRVDLHSGDGLHLNSKAYQILDKTVVPTLDRAFRKK